MSHALHLEEGKLGPFQGHVALVRHGRARRGPGAGRARAGGGISAQCAESATSTLTELPEKPMIVQPSAPPEQSIDAFIDRTHHDPGTPDPCWIWLLLASRARCRVYPSRGGARHGENR